MFDQIKLADLADLAMGETIIAEDCDGKGFPIYSASTDEAPWNHSSHISRRLTPGTIVVGARGSIGFPRMPTAEKFGATQTTITVTSREGAVHPRFLFHALRNLDFKALTSQQAIPMLTVADLGAVSLPRPPLDEQAEIVGALDTLDTTIRQTEAIIAKLKQLKQGLLHDLLTRGIDANGELRPPQSEAPHLYKASPLGWIPVEWHVQRLADFTASDITYGIVQAGPHIEGGIPYIRTGDMSGEYLDRAGLQCTSTRIAKSYSRSEVRAGDIVMAIRATVGKVLPVPIELDGANLTQGTARIAPNSNFDPTFLLWALRFQRTQDSISAEIKGTTFAEITLAALREIPVAAPMKLVEQRAIAERMQACERRIDAERAQLQKLRRQKSGLMDDLLTGRVRVTPLLAQQAA